MSTIELAVVLPVLMLLVVGLCDYGLATYTDIQVQQAAHAGAAKVEVDLGYVPDQVPDRVREAVQAATPLGSSISVDLTGNPWNGCVVGGAIEPHADMLTPCPDGNNAGGYVTVRTQMTYTTLIPWPGIPGSFVFQGRSTVRFQ